MGKKIGYVLFTILLSVLAFGIISCENEEGGGGGGAPLEVQLDQTQCKSVGFGAQAQVTVEVISTTKRPITYEWKFGVASGNVGEWPGGDPEFGLPAPTLTGADTDTVSFTTFTIEETLANLNRGLRDRFEIRPFSAQEVNYILDVKVSDGKDEIEEEIRCTSAPQYGGWEDEYIPSNFDPETETLPFQANTHLGLPVYFNGGIQNSYNWSITGKPAGSAASIPDASSRTPHFTPDVVGDYMITESVSRNSFSIFNVSEWLGVTADGVNCMACHSIAQTRSDDDRTLTPKYQPWLATGHASFFQRGVDGELSPSYNEGCIYCHTVGYDLGNTIFNGGFDDVQEMVGWEFPAELMPGNFDAIPADLQVLGNIQCENCHGPGKEHAESGGSPDAIIVNYTANDCFQCHDEPPFHLIPNQWNNSPHSKFVTTGNLQTSPLGEDDPALNSSCARCHSTAGNVIWIRNGGEPGDVPTFAPPADFAEPQTCSACHDPHNEAGYPAQVRRFGSFTTLAMYTVPDSVGVGATCIGCHNSRRPISNPNTLTNQNDAHASLQGDIFLGENLWFESDAPGGVYPNSPHSTATENACVDCHMAANRDQAGPERNRVGDHTHLVKDGDTDFENTGLLPTDQNPQGSGCLSAGCHATSGETFAFNIPHTYGDFNGNGMREGVQTEVEGLLEALKDEIGEFAMDAGWDAGCVPEGKPSPVPFHGRVRLLKSCCTIEQAETDESCFTHPAGGIPDEDVFKASFNFLALEEDKSEGVHNTAFAVTALRTSYEQVAGVPFSGDPYPHAEDWDGIHPAVVEQDNVGRCVGCHFEDNPYNAPFPAPFAIAQAPCSSCHQE
ncbi:MAG TPA: hypothetical protein VGA95_13190 [Thermodesulfobacteriota bacterium]